MISTWELIKAGEYEKACDQADLEGQKSKSLLPLRNKIFALLMLRRYADSESLGESIIEISHGSSDSDFIFLGLSRWLLGKHSEAISMWQQSVHTKFTDALGGAEIYLLVWYAAVSLKNRSLAEESNDSLRKLYFPKKPKAWPGPIVGYILKDLSEADLRSQISSQAIVHEKQLCQANFYIGIQRLVDGDLTGFHQAMNEVLNLKPSGLVKAEFYLARSESEK